MGSKEYLEHRLRESFSGSRHHSFMGSLRGVTDEQARWIPPQYKGFPHMDGSILNLAYHTGADKHVMMSFCFDDQSVTWPAMQARFEQLGGSLQAAIQIAKSGLEVALETLAGIPEHELDSNRPYYNGKTLTAYEIFTIIAEHDIYHAGQINYIRNMLAGRIGRL